MKYLEIKSSPDVNANIDLICRSLWQGQVVVLLTDTIYGLSCLANNTRALAKISRIKQRTEKKAFILLASSLKMVEQHAYLSIKQRTILKNIYGDTKRPTTFILRSRHNLPSELSGGKDTLAFRLPKNDFLIKILKRLKRPIVSTSLNISGGAPLSDVRLIKEYFNFLHQWPDLVVDSGICRRRRSSRVIDLTTNDSSQVVRH